MNRRTALATPLTARTTPGLAVSRPSEHWTQTVWSGPWPGVAGALAVLILLLAFSHVVSLGVQQGELRRQTMARQALQLWRCDAPPQRLPGSCATDANSGDAREAQALLSASPGTYSPYSPYSPYSQVSLRQATR